MSNSNRPPYDPTHRDQPDFRPLDGAARTGRQPRVGQDSGRQPYRNTDLPTDRQPYSRQDHARDEAPRRPQVPSRNANGEWRKQREPITQRRPISQAEMDEYEFLRKAHGRKKQRKKRTLVITIAALILIVGVYALILALDLGGGANTFYAGITVDGIKMNGYTKEEAAAQLQRANADRINGLTVRLSYSGQEWSIAPELIGAQLNINDVVEEAWAIGHEGNIFARQAEIRKVKGEGMAFRTMISYDTNELRSRLMEIKQGIDTPALDATMTFDPEKEEQFRITQEENGRSVDVDMLLTQVVTQLDNGFTSVIEIKPEVVSPKIFAETLQQCTKKLSRVTTDLGSSSDSRIHNVTLALSNFNGLMIPAGQELSFNQTTGARGLEQGYENAGVIQDDEVVDGPGGGVCQASTTLYQAALKAGLEIVRSNKHSMTVSYVDPGTDAAVAYDYKDLVIKNNTEYPVFIEGKVSGKTVVVAVYGYKADEAVTYEIVSDVYETIPAPEPEIVLDTAAEFVTYTDETLEKKKSRSGVKVRSYRVTKVNGEETDRELLRDDYYKEVTGVTYQGVTTRPEGYTPPKEDTKKSEDDE